ncbi:MAG: hypothetical protein NT124_01830 [Candidatus Dependentiae bacterium]|nr:hypothetical protein [Candidatus Dependentiae bacterium]
MKNVLLFKKTGLLLTMILLLSSSMTMRAELTVQKAAGLSFVTAICYLVTKSKAAENPVTLKTFPAFLDEFKHALVEGNSKKIALLLAKFTDDFVIGFEGKTAGLDIAGSSVIVTGEDTIKSTIRNGELVSFYGKEAVPSYGFVATIWSKIKKIAEAYDKLDKAKKAMDGINGWINAK